MGIRASWTTAGLAVNLHNIAAVYSGDGHYISSAATLIQQVHYAFSGFLPPLAANGSYNLGRTLPIQFQLTDANGNFINSLSAIGSLQVLDSSGNDVLAGTGNTGLRYDPTTKDFIFNWQTKGLSAGSYTIVLTLTDGMTYSLTVQLS